MKIGAMIRRCTLDTSAISRHMKTHRSNYRCIASHQRNTRRSMWCSRPHPTARESSTQPTRQTHLLVRQISDSQPKSEETPMPSWGSRILQRSSRMGITRVSPLPIIMSIRQLRSKSRKQLRSKRVYSRITRGTMTTILTRRTSQSLSQLMHRVSSKTGTPLHKEVSWRNLLMQRIPTRKKTDRHKSHLLGHSLTIQPIRMLPLTPRSFQLRLELSKHQITDRLNK